MFFRVIVYIIGFLLAMLGNFYMLVYMNLFSFGYNIIEYLEYVFTRYECYYTVIGFILIMVAIMMKGDKK